MNLTNIQEIIKEAVSLGETLGYARAAKAFCPTFDNKIKVKKIRQWCIANDISWATFQQLEESGSIKKKASGTSANAAQYYDIDEILKAYGCSSLQFKVAANL